MLLSLYLNIRKCVEFLKYCQVHFKWNTEINDHKPSDMQNNNHQRCEYVSLYDKGKWLKVTDNNKVANQLTLKWGDYLGLFQWDEHKMILKSGSGRQKIPFMPETRETATWDKLCLTLLALETKEVQPQAQDCGCPLKTEKGKEMYYLLDTKK